VIRSKWITEQEAGAARRSPHDPAGGPAPADPMTLSVVLTRGARRTIGGPEVMRDQFRHLIAQPNSKRDNSGSSIQ